MNFPDHLTKKWEFRLDFDKEFAFEEYFNSLTNSQSNFNFFEFLAEDYDYAYDNALNCLEYGFDIEKIPGSKVRDWILSVTECMNTLLGQYLERKGKEFRDDDQNVEFRIRRFLSTLGPEWKFVSTTLQELWRFSRSVVAHTPEGRQLKKSPAIRKKALNYKDDYVSVHMESLSKIREEFQNYER